MNDYEKSIMLFRHLRCFGSDCDSHPSEESLWGHAIMSGLNLPVPVDIY